MQVTQPTGNGGITVFLRGYDSYTTTKGKPQVLCVLVGWALD